MPTGCNTWFLLQILLLAQHVSGTIMPFIRSSRVLYKWLLPVVFGAWFSSCRYGVELRVVCPVCGLLHNNCELWPSKYLTCQVLWRPQFTTTVLLYEYMDQYCKHNGIPLSAYFIYLNLDSILAWWWLYIAETCRRTKTDNCHFMIKIFVFIDWLMYYYSKW